MANEEQAVFWTEIGGPVWLANEEQLEASAARFGMAALDVAGVQPGEAASIDVGCGTGSTTLELARRLGDGGRVVGVDISPLLLGRARERGNGQVGKNVEFIEADAQTHDFDDASADLVFSRFGVMFFEDSVAAFANLRRALKPGGRLTFVCWQDPPSNQWMSVPVGAAISVLGPPDAPPPDGPVPFRFADADRLRDILQTAGFVAIDIQDYRTTMDVPVDEGRERLGFIARMGPLGARFADADEQTQARTLDAILDAAAPFVSDGMYRMPATTWIVVARSS